jgi:hypothetical protein
VPSLGVDAIKPHWLERQSDHRSPAFVARGDADGAVNVTSRNWTTVGTVASASTTRAIVDPRGLVTPRPGGWSLDWWIGAEDRWHFPSREAAVRQQLVGGTPVVETAMRIPGGDAVQRVYAVPDDLVVVEITNETPTPIAVAFAVRPYHPTGMTPIGRIALDDRTVTVDGRPAVVFARRPQRLATSTAVTGDVVARIHAEDFDTALANEVCCERGLATAAFLFPLAHRQTLRVVLPMADNVVDVDADALPDRDAVVRSWHAQTTSRGLHLALPEGRLAAAVDANRRSLLLAPAQPAVVVAMDHHGFHKDSADVLRSCTGRKSALDTSLLPAMTEHWRLSGSLDDIDGETVVRLVRAIQREDRDPDGLAYAAALVRAFGLEPLADECERWSPSRPAPSARPMHGDGGIDVLATLRQAADELALGDRAALDRLSWLLDVASPTWAWPSFVHPSLGTGCGGDGHDGRVTAAFLSLVRGLLVREAADGGLALCSMLPDAWVGQALEVHDAPTRFGKVSFAVRYHGERPALLWDLKARAGAPPVSLTAPGLDPAWSSTDAKGEALLAAAPGATPAVAIPVEGSFN